MFWAVDGVFPLIVVRFYHHCRPGATEDGELVHEPDDIAISVHDVFQGVNVAEGTAIGVMGLPLEGDRLFFA